MRVRQSGLVPEVAAARSLFLRLRMKLLPDAGGPTSFVFLLRSRGQSSRGPGLRGPETAWKCAHKLRAFLSLTTACNHKSFKCARNRRLSYSATCRLRKVGDAMDVILGPPSQEHLLSDETPKTVLLSVDSFRKCCARRYVWDKVKV